MTRASPPSPGQSHPRVGQPPSASGSSPPPPTSPGRAAPATRVQPDRGQSFDRHSGLGGNADPPGRDPNADPDVDGVALAAATATGVLLGTRFAVAAAWVVAAFCLAVACLGAGAVSRLREVGGSSAVLGVLVLSTLLASGGAAAAVRATAVRGGVLLAWVRQPARAEVTATVAEEPRRLRYGGHWVVLTVHQIHRDGTTYRTRERTGMVVPRGRLAPPQRPQSPPAASAEPAGPAASTGPDPGDERLGVGDRLRVRASVGEARWSDALGRQPPVVLRNPIIEERAPPGGAALRISERVRDAARSRALASLAPERAGLLVGMALGDTSLLPAQLERDFQSAGLTHLMAVSGANLAVVLAAGLWLAGATGAGRRGLAVIGIVLVVVLVVVTRWEPSVLRAGVMAGLVLLGVASGRGPGGRRALCLAVVVLLLADPGLAGALGFQLSVVATAGVLWVGPAMARALPDRIPERVRKGVGMTLGAQATAVPALALVFGSVSPAGLPANLLGLPLGTVGQS
jgi:competence protein ComEC